MSGSADTLLAKVFARLSPEDRRRVVKCLQDNGFALRITDEEGAVVEAAVSDDASETKFFLHQPGVDPVEVETEGAPELSRVVLVDASDGSVWDGVSDDSSSGEGG